MGKFEVLFPFVLLFSSVCMRNSLIIETLFSFKEELILF